MVRISRKQVRLFTAIVLFVSMVIVLLAPYTTGIPLHEWLGFLILIPWLIHLIVDWKWIVSTTRTFFKRGAGRSKFNYVLDWVLFFLLTVMIVSGVLISEAALPAIGIHINVDPFWFVIHTIASRFFMMLLGVHLALHLVWIMGAIKSSSARTVDQELDGDPNISEKRGLFFNHMIRPILIIGLAAGAVAIAVLPLGLTDWAQELRPAGIQASEEARARPMGIETTLIDLYWGGIIMGIPALITLSVLGFFRLFKFMKK